jgi:hypothetical protein
MNCQVCRVEIVDERREVALPNGLYVAACDDLARAKPFVALSRTAWIDAPYRSTRMGAVDKAVDDYLEDNRGPTAQEFKYFQGWSLRGHLTKT